MTQRTDILAFDELSLTLLYDILSLRSEVFVVEQDAVYIDIDGLDAQALHICVMENEKLVGYARIFAPGIKFDEASVGRIVMDVAHRGSGLGSKLVKRGMDEIAARFGNPAILIEAQYQLRGFYEALGFAVVSDTYDWGGIPHYKMSTKTAA